MPNNVSISVCVSATKLDLTYTKLNMYFFGCLPQINFNSFINVNENAATSIKVIKVAAKSLKLD